MAEKSPKRIMQFGSIFKITLTFCPKVLCADLIHPSNTFAVQPTGSLCQAGWCITVSWCSGCSAMMYYFVPIIPVPSFHLVTWYIRSFSTVIAIIPCCSYRVLYRQIIFRSERKIRMLSFLYLEIHVCISSVIADSWACMMTCSYFILSMYDKSYGCIITGSLDINFFICSRWVNEQWMT